ncbi:MAG: epoxyqueuosine reductase QueH [Bacteroidaceae bacterium]|nr:epoxyqueuosine reductase QueH [Bacteroidaceae bacterium]
MKKILLHCCCAPCSSAIIEWMLANGIRPTLFYYNPNIFPEEEYRIRKNELTRYAEKLGLDVIDEDYCHESWLEQICGMEDEPERGKRCLQCFKIRLLRTAQKAAELGFDEITTTLASSRWKSLAQINEAGAWAADQVKGVHFNDRNWRKGGLQERRNELLRTNGFYNQLYCGCEFSLSASPNKKPSLSPAPTL